MANQPSLIPSAWAANNSTTETIPATTTESGKASWDQGFPVETSLPLSQGGIPPKYGDFNGVLNVLSQFCLFAQSGGQYAWVNSLDYSVGSIVLGTDGSIYRAAQVSGPSTAAVNPVGDTSGKWERIVSKSDIDALEEDIQDAMDAASDAASNASAAQSAVTTLDANVVKLSGAQTITGAKTFTNDITTENANPSYACKITSIERANNPNSDSWCYPIKYLDKNGDFLGYVELYFGTNGARRARLCTYKQDGTTAYIQVGFDRYGVAYANAPTPSTANSNSTEIATTAWVTSAPAVVHTSGDETIAGEKTFTSFVTVEAGSPSYRTKATNTTKGTAPSSTQWQDFNFGDKDGNRIAGFSTSYINAKDVTLFLIANKMNTASDTDWFSCNVKFYANGTTCFFPSTNGTSYLGIANNRWNAVYASNGTIQTSDARLKSDIDTIPEAVLDAWENVHWKQFLFNDAIAKKGQAARLHTGLIAQQIDEVFQAHGLDAARYGLFCHDAWDAQPEEKDDKGNIMQEARPAGDAYSLRYDEALCMEAAYQRRRADRAEARITALEQRLGELEAVLASLISPISDEQTAEPQEGEGDE